jgi:hypothetical protein
MLDSSVSPSPSCPRRNLDEQLGLWSSQQTPHPSSLLSSTDHFSNFAPFTNIDQVAFPGPGDEQEANGTRSLSPISESVAVTQPPEPLALDETFGQEWSHEEGLKGACTPYDIRSTGPSGQVTDSRLEYLGLPNHAAGMPLAEAIGQLPSSSSFGGLSSRPGDDHSELRASAMTEPMDELWFPDFHLSMFSQFPAFTGM